MEENYKQLSRRDFMRTFAIGAGGIILLGNYGVAYGWTDSDKKTIRGIIVDFTKCTGCRTCETVCSGFNNLVEVKGEMLNGLGNPYLSNIKVHWFNPDVDVPMVCSVCEDSPCINACPVRPDQITGRKALYKDENLHTVLCDMERCIGCGLCARTCKEQRTGVIYQDEDGKPHGICNLCNGDPKCVKYCSFDALSYAELRDEGGFRKKSPEQIARELIMHFYEIEI